MSAFMNQSDLEALKAYVRSNESGMNRAESTIILNVSHSGLKTTNFMEIRFDLHMTVEAVKHKLVTMCGTSPSAMLLQLKDEHGKVLAVLDDDTRMLGFYSPYEGCRLHVIDTDPTSLAASGWLEDTSKVEKYVMSDEDYSKRENSYRKFKEQKLKEDPTWTLEKEICIRKGIPYVPPVVTTDENAFQEQASTMQVGQRCSVDPGDRRGEVKYVGRVDGLPLGYWIGVQYDEPLGKNDGSSKGKKYFDCPKGYGAFVRPDKVQVGDFPPVDDFLDSEDEI